MSENKDFNYSLNFRGIDKLTSPLGKIQKTIGKTSQELRSFRTLEKNFGQFKALRQNAPKVSANLKEASLETAKLGREMAATSNPNRKMQADFKRAQKAVQGLRAQQSKEIAELAKLGGSLRRAGYNTNDFKGTQDKLKSSISRTKKEMESQRKELKRVSEQYRRSKAAKDQYQKSLQTSANMGIVGASGVAVGTRSVKGVFSLVETIRPLEAAIGELQSLGVENIQVYRDQAAQTDAKLAYTTADSFIRAAYDIRSGMSGLSDEGVAGITDYALITARATKSSAEQMTSLTASAYGIFKSQYSDMTDMEWGAAFTGGLASSVKAFKTDGAKMQQSIESVGSGAAKLGMDMREQFAVLGTLQTSMSAGEAGTALASYARSSAKAHEFFAKKGVDVKILDENGQLRDTMKVMDDIRKAYGDEIDGFEAAEITKAFGRAEAVKVIDGLINNQETFDNGFKEITAGMKDGKQYITEMAAARDDNADAQLQNAIEDWGTAKQELGYAFLPIFQQMIPLLGKATAWLKEFSSEHKTLMGFIGGGIVIFGGLAAVMGGLTIAMASILGPFAMLKLATTTLGIKGLGLARILPIIGKGILFIGRALLMNPIGLAITGIALGAYLIMKHWKPIKGFFGALWNGLKTIFAWSPLGAIMRAWSPAFAWIKSVFDTPKETARATWSVLKTLFAWSPLGTIVRAWSPAFAWIKSVFDTPKETARATWSVLKTLFAWSPLGAIMRAWSPAFAWIKSVFDTPKETARATWSVLKTLFAWSPIGIIVRAWSPAFAWIKSVFDTPKETAGATWSVLKTLFAWSPLGAIMRAWGPAFLWIKSAFGKPKETARATWSVLKTLFAWSPIGIIVRAWSPAFAWIKSVFDTPKETAGATWSVLKTLFAWSPLGTIVRAWSPAFAWIKSVFDTPKETARATWSVLKTLFAWSPLGTLRKAWGIVPDEFSSIFGRASDFTRIQMDKIKGFISAPFEMLGNLKDRLTFKGTRERFKALISASKEPLPFKKSAMGLKSAARVGATTAGFAGLSMAAPALAERPPIILQGPDIGSSSLYAPKSATIHEGDNHWHIYPSAGMDEAALARFIGKEIDKRKREDARKKSNSLHDIEDDA